MPDLWKPTADQATLRQRHQLMQQLRHFFDSAGLMEVETPMLSAHATPDLHLASVTSSDGYLHTSPEYPMKRLLAAGSGGIYQVCKVFRSQESGRSHNPEFTLLEWYQPDWTDRQLAEQVIALFRHLGYDRPAVFKSYREAFSDLMGVDPLSANTDRLQALAAELTNRDCSSFDRNTCLDVAMSLGVEPALDKHCITVITDFPAAQAALAIKEQQPDGFWTARRFEVYSGGLELANGYSELTDATEQQQRFEAENVARADLGLPEMPIDIHLLAAMKQGLPACAGVAVGVDRLMMLCLGKSHINDVLSFPFDRA